MLFGRKGEAVNQKVRRGKIRLKWKRAANYTSQLSVTAK
jgi:hypothetical protein